MNKMQGSEVQGEKKPVPFQAGEKGFAVFWLLFGGFFFYQSILLCRAHPGLNSCAAIPLFVTGSIVLCAITLLLIDRKAPSVTHGVHKGKTIRMALDTMFPVNVLALLALIILYCLALYFKLGFYLSTGLFLWCGMTFYMRSQYHVNGVPNTATLGKVMLKNLLWTGLSLLFILAVFTYLFHVVLP
ncbi:tripartite tricarboxylate transporter TctB family protein [Oscillibacter sp.]|uniref:tripartite tricarboxylate transporter TctB family protein n=1 Tax=Oscillibacter sp. TaxID=1945593 RepID=UPI003390C93D